MPGRRAAVEIDTSLCRRCQLNEPSITVRTEPLCKACFCRYVSTKVVKRMENFRVRHSETGQGRILLLPLSFGPASTSMLHILSQHIERQVERSGKAGFYLHVLHVDDGTSTQDGQESDFLHKVKERYSQHIYSRIPLSDVVSLDEFSHLLEHVNDQNSLLAEDIPNASKLKQVLTSLDSVTSRADVMQTLKRRLVVRFAKEHNCDAILWGDSTTRLAERILAETAKGRGISLPWLVGDGQSPHNIPFYYPMRELLSKEIASFTSLLEPALDDLMLEAESKPAVSTRNTTIDDLMKQYFDSVERDYPSIVANVVRTAGKLHPTALNEIEMQCELCDMPLDGQAPERSRLCYGCIRTLPRAVG